MSESHRKIYIQNPKALDSRLYKIYLKYVCKCLWSKKMGITEVTKHQETMEMFSPVYKKA